jgi:hypothetical protein
VQARVSCSQNEGGKDHRNEKGTGDSGGMSAAIKAPLENFLLHLLLLGAKQCIELDAMKAPLAKVRGRLLVRFPFSFSFCTADWGEGETGGPRKVA